LGEGSLRLKEVGKFHFQKKKFGKTNPPDHHEGINFEGTKERTYQNGKPYECGGPSWLGKRHLGTWLRTGSNLKGQPGGNSALLGLKGNWGGEGENLNNGLRLRETEGGHRVKLSYMKRKKRSKVGNGEGKHNLEWVPGKTGDRAPAGTKKQNWGTRQGNHLGEKIKLGYRNVKNYADKVWGGNEG